MKKNTIIKTKNLFKFIFLNISKKVNFFIFLKFYNNLFLFKFKIYNFFFYNYLNYYFFKKIEFNNYYKLKNFFILLNDEKIGFSNYYFFRKLKYYFFLKLPFFSLNNALIKSNNTLLNYFFFKDIYYFFFKDIYYFFFKDIYYFFFKDIYYFFIYINLIYIFLIKFKRNNAAQRHKKTFKFFKYSFFKYSFFKYSFLKQNGLNNNGFITVRYKSNKKKKLNILFDNKMTSVNKLGILIKILKYNNYKPFFGLIRFVTGSFSYFYIQHGCIIGQFFKNLFAPLKYQFFIYPGIKIPLKFLSNEYIFCFISINNSNLKFYCSSAGVFSKILNQVYDIGLTKIILPTNEIKFINFNLFVTVGRNSNLYNFFQNKSNAKSMYFKNKKSSVRGVAMNPVDHPHGGRTKTNKPECSPWGWITKKSH